jgi:hypothetical protein
MTQTRRDKQILRAAVRYLVRQYRQSRSMTVQINLMHLVAQRHRIAYDDSPIPCPRWIEEPRPCPALAGGAGTTWTDTTKEQQP